MITSFHIENFKALRNVRFGLGRLNLVVGPNASGKSSILEALELFASLRENKLWVLTEKSAIADMLSRNSTGPIKFVCGMSVPAGEATYEIRANIDKNGVGVGTLKGSGQVDAPKEVDFNNQYPPVGRMPSLKALPRSIMLNFEPSRLAAASYSDEEVPSVGFDGEGLASALADLALSDPAALHAIQESFREVVPSFVRVKPQRVRLRRVEEGEILAGLDGLQRKATERTVWGYELRFDFLGAENLPATHVSEGSLLTLGLLTVILSRARPTLILMDEIERGLHPRALATLVSQLRKLIATLPDLQIVATTHSPYLVDHFEPEEVLVTSLDENGHGSVSPLSDHKDITKMRETLNSGEFWSTVGEEWVSANGHHAKGGHGA